MYTVIVEYTGINGTHFGEFGPFLNRVTAEECVLKLVGSSLSIVKVTIKDA